MLIAKVGAATSPEALAPKKHQTEFYKNSLLTSNIKSEIGTLLLCLQFPVGQELSQVGWNIFEAKLRKYVELRILGGLL